jgi:hypothetical protein
MDSIISDHGYSCLIYHVWVKSLTSPSVKSHNAALISFYPVRNNARRSAAGLDLRIIPAGFNGPPVESLWVERLEFLTGFAHR